MTIYVDKSGAGMNYSTVNDVKECVIPKKKGAVTVPIILKKKACGEPFTMLSDADMERWKEYMRKEIGNKASLILGI